ncbi:hypothetical protein SAMN04488506_0957 [Desemzia incerta]|uniref:Uncharacterized protein n=1 Tax=Desemzia incerta TaxID=82801 RepID=A0A1I5WLI1_9LACT|nr:hypothetical protein SAMN04488506_0957 [Desemzia incerta]
MFFELLLIVGVLTIPIWGVVFCLNLISIIEKIQYKKDFTKNKVWFTISFVIMVSTITYGLVASS